MNITTIHGMGVIKYDTEDSHLSKSVAIAVGMNYSDEKKTLNKAKMSKVDLFGAEVLLMYEDKKDISYFVDAMTADNNLNKLKGTIRCTPYNKEKGEVIIKNIKKQNALLKSKGLVEIFEEKGAYLVSSLNENEYILYFPTGIPVTDHEGLEAEFANKLGHFKVLEKFNIFKETKDFVVMHIILD